MTPEQKIAMEAAAWRKLQSHFQKRTDVQNIDVMNLAGFCRNCMVKWLVSGAKEQGIELDYEDARTQVYGIPYSEWKNEFQAKATAEQLEKFNALGPDDITE